MSAPTAVIPGSTISTGSGMSKAGIGSTEKTLRAAAIASANGHNAMEGLFSSPFSHNLQKRYIDGEMEIEDAVQAAKRHYGLA